MASSDKTLQEQMIMGELLAERSLLLLSPVATFVSRSPLKKNYRGIVLGVKKFSC